MQLPTLLSIILACIVAAAAMPLQLTDVHNQPTNLGWDLGQALRDANRQIGQMLETIDDAKKNPNGEAMGRIKMAFGPHAPMENIEKNILILKTGTMRVLVKDKLEKDRLAVTRWVVPGDPSSVQTEISKEAFGQETPEYRAATVLHEATHYHLKTSDHYVDINGKTRMLAMREIPATGETGKDHYIKGGGYALKEDYHTPLQATDFNDLFIRVRDTALNMDLNADSYTLLGMLCAHHELLQLGLLKGTNRPSGSGEPSGSGGSRQKDPGSPTTSVKIITPDPASGSGGATTSARPVTPPARPSTPVAPNPASGSGGATTPATPVTPVALDPASGSGTSGWRKFLPSKSATTPVTPNPAGPITSNPASGSGKSNRLVKKRPNPASGSGNT